MAYFNQLKSTQACGFMDIEDYPDGSVLAQFNCKRNGSFGGSLSVGSNVPVASVSITATTTLPNAITNLASVIISNAAAIINLTLPALLTGLTFWIKNLNSSVTTLLTPGAANILSLESPIGTYSLVNSVVLPINSTIGITCDGTYFYMWYNSASLSSLSANLNYLASLTSASAVDASNNFHVLHSLAVGTGSGTIPSYNFDMPSASATARIGPLTQQGTSAFSLLNSAVSNPSTSYALSQTTAGLTQLNSGNSQNLILSNTNSEVMRLTSNGRVGILKNVPAYALDVTGTIATDTDVLINGTSVLSGLVAKSQTFVQNTSQAVYLIGTLQTGNVTSPTRMEINIVTGSGFTQTSQAETQKITILLNSLDNSLGSGVGNLAGRWFNVGNGANIVGAAVYTQTYNSGPANYTYNIYIQLAAHSGGVCYYQNDANGTFTLSMSTSGNSLPGGYIAFPTNGMSVYPDLFIGASSITSSLATINATIATLAVDSTVVHLAGTESITGNKSFNGTSTFLNNLIANSQTVTPTNLGHVSGASSNLQGQLTTITNNYLGSQNVCWGCVTWNGTSYVLTVGNNVFSLTKNAVGNVTIQSTLTNLNGVMLVVPAGAAAYTAWVISQNSVAGWAKFGLQNGGAAPTFQDLSFNFVMF